MSAVPERLATALADRYRIERELGAGGMATVYLAHDVRHDRKVALKVLRPELSAVIGAERFLVEIKTTANLQHPHILALYDSGQVDGTVFYVMPFVVGESLRDRIAREKQLPVGDAVRMATEVAGALDYAHRQGVIHRDIKPENILLHDGRALVADFGIALAASRTEGSARMTETGMSLGTPHYMSPEQALGERNLDARTDVYALGCVLHEMLAGEPPFSGPSAQAIIARVMNSEPEPVTALRKSVPEHIAEAILIALAKLPADRFASAAEFASALGGGGDAVGYRSGGTRAARAAKRSRATRLLWPASAALLSIVALWGWLRPSSSARDLVPSRLAILTPGLGGAYSGLQRLVDITPDGRTLIYSLLENGSGVTMRRHLGDVEARAIPGVEPNLAGYVISKDGREFLATNSVLRQTIRVPLGGGSGKPLPRDVGTTSYSAWTGDGALLANVQNDVAQGIVRVGTGGEVTRPFIESGGDLNIQQVLPGDRWALVLRAPMGTAVGTPHLLDLRSGATEPLMSTDVVEMRYTAGFLVSVLADGTMEAVAFDPAKRRISGSPVVIATGVALTGTGMAQFAVSANGTVAYVPEEPRSLVLVDRQGNARAVTSERRNYHIPRFSPDGRRILTDFNSVDGRDVWLLELDGGTLSRVSFDRDGHDATWEPGGEFITYGSSLRSGGVLGLYRTRPGRSGEVDSLFASAQLSFPGSWLPDRSGLVTQGLTLVPGSRGDIGIVRNGGRGPLEPLIATRFEEQFPALSPDGKWLAYVSDQSGRDEVYVRALSGNADQLRVSLTGGVEAVWAPNGRELYYRANVEAGASLVSASIRLSPTLAVTERRQLFDVSDIVTSAPHANYDVSPDGRTFAMVRQNPSTRLMVIQNLPALVRELERGTRR